MKIIGITGWKNSGKTTLVCKLVNYFSSQGSSISTIKHTHHNVEFDQPNKDSYKHRDAGAQEVILATKNRWAIFHEQEEELGVSDLIAKLAPVDILLIEGFKNHDHPKIQVYRGREGEELLLDQKKNIVAVATDDNCVTNLSVPVLDLNNVEEIAQFIQENFAVSNN